MGGVTTTISGGGSGADIGALKDEFLSKKNNDTAKGIIDFVKGLKIASAIIKSVITEQSEKNPDDESIMTAARVIKELEELVDKLDDKYLRKDQPDGTNFLLTIGEFIDSMIAGKGTGIFPNGRIQTDRLEVRGSMTVMDLIINEIHAMAGEFGCRRRPRQISRTWMKMMC